MKYTAILATVLPFAAALPAESDTAFGSRETLEQLTDRYLYSLSLPDFSSRRDDRDPATVDWTSDGCTSSPDNPFGFPFVPGCHRHDFGYRNYRLQDRFTKENKERIDDNFRDDLYYQCDSVSFSVRFVCDALAQVYWAAVRAFGGDDAKKREEQAELVAEYNNYVAIYDAAVKEAQEKGDLPVLDN